HAGEIALLLTECRGSAGERVARSWRDRGSRDVRRGIVSVGGAQLEQCAEDDHQADGGGSQSAATEIGRERLPERGRRGSCDRCLFANDAFGFKLIAQGNPNALWGSHFGRHTLSSGDNGVEVGNQILARRAAGDVNASFLGKRRNLILLQNAF